LDISTMKTGQLAMFQFIAADQAKKIFVDLGWQW
jgi:hypothetical protein